MRELAEHLLRSGVAPAVVKRYIGELADHRDDLVAELIASGMDPDGAAIAAQRRLGDREALTRSILSDARFQSIASRAPLLAWLGIPLLTQGVLAFLVALTVVLAARNGLSAERLEAIAGAILLFCPLAIAWSLLAGARRHRATLLWPAVGIIGTVLLGAALKLRVEDSAVAVSVVSPGLAQLVAYALLVLAPLLRKSRAA